MALLDFKKWIFFFCFLFIFENTQALQSTNIYQFTQAGMFSPAVKNALFRVYVPNEYSNSVSVIDPKTYQVIETFKSGRNPQHVVPAYDLKALWVLNNKSNSVTPIDPTTGKPGKSIHVTDPYNLYFTPDGKFAIVVCESRKELQFRDPQSMKLIYSLPIKCSGANHMDFTLDSRYAIATCEFSGQLMKVDLINNKVQGYLTLNAVTPQNQSISQNSSKSTNSVEAQNALASQNLQNTSKTQKMLNSYITLPNAAKNNEVAMKNKSKNIAIKDKKSTITSKPQDIRSSPDGSIFFVADMLRDGVILIDPIKFTEIGFIHTGIGTHGVYPNRNGTLFYVSNRGCHMMHCPPHGPGSVSVLDPLKKVVLATWNIPQGGSPDMGNISADGKELWLSGRFDNEVYVFDTATGNLTHRIPVGKRPHGLAFWPQPGRFSLGHTGNMR